MSTLFSKIAARTGQIAILIDPDKTQDEQQLLQLVDKIHFSGIDYIFVGGSTVTKEAFERTIALLKDNTSLPLVIFPGSHEQFSEKADALLYLSLLSGRNPEYLIGQHVASAQKIFRSKIEVIPTAYLLIDGGTKSAVAYVSQTTPIPRNQYGIAVNTALAGVLQGKKVVFFDAGSGAEKPVPQELIQSLRKETSTPIIVGGGVCSISSIEAFSESGANLIVIGNKIEEDTDFLLDIAEYKNQLRITNRLITNYE